MSQQSTHPERVGNSCLAGALVKSLIDQNGRGRLIFATHDLCAEPNPFACPPDFFEQVVQWTVDSGASILPVTRAQGALLASPPASGGGMAAKAHEVNTTTKVTEQ